ncbi:MAG: hypothetical protein HONBIEJF_01776 [Fimbriimonadaceae bacterium]|nr:hypothetical protein [Fimbriimonadaceae bacterium]
MDIEKSDLQDGQEVGSLFLDSCAPVEPDMKSRDQPMVSRLAASPIETAPPQDSTTRRAKPNKHNPLLRWLAVLTLLSLASFGIWRRLTALPLVSTEAVRIEELWTSFTAEGVVRGTEYSLGSEYGGRVVELRIREGEQVRRGQILLRLNAEQPRFAVEEMEAALRSAITDVARAKRERDLVAAQYHASLSAARARKRQAELAHRQLLSGARPEEVKLAVQRTARARAALEEAEKSYRRAEALFQADAIARASLEKAEASYKAAQADLHSAEAAEQLVRAGPSIEQVEVSQAAIAAAEAEIRSVESEAGRIEVADKSVSAAASRVIQARAAVKRAQRAVQEHVVTAPSDGTLTRLLVEPGSVLVPGALALVISTRKDLRIEAEISTEDTPKLGPGMEVVVTAAAYPGRVFRARVQNLMPAGELKPDAAIRTRIVRARIELLQSSDLFRPGMEVDIEGRNLHGKCASVPTDAVRFTGDSASVLIVEDGRVVERQIGIGMQNPDRTEVVSGIRVGERVIVTGKDELRPGDRVQAVQ